MLTYRIIDNLDCSTDELQQLIASLPEWRRQQALKFKFRQGRLECALSYSLLSEMLGCQPEFLIGEHGKPYIDGRYFNLSHCKKAVACIVSDTSDVGIDVECLGRYEKSLAEYCMSDEELRQIASAQDPDEEFTILWTKKEALLKCTGEGIIDDIKTCLNSDRTADSAGSSIGRISIESGLNKEKGYAWSIAYSV